MVAEPHAAPPANPAPPVPGKRLRPARMVLPIGLSLIVLTIAVTASQIMIDRGQQIAFWRASAEADARGLAAHALQTLQSADLVLRSVTDRVHDRKVSDNAQLRALLGTPEIHDMLVQRSSGAAQVSVASIVDQNGDMVNFTRNFPPRSNSGELINLGERDYFKAHKSDPNLDVFLSKPVQNKGTGTWTFYLARKIKSQSGAFLGVVLAGIESSYFEQFYKAINVEGRRVSMFLESGELLARWPDTSSTERGMDFRNATWKTVLSSGQASAVLQPGVVGAVSESGQELRIVAPVVLREYPLVVTVRVTEALIFKSWYRSALTISLLATGLCLILLWATLTLRRMLAAQELAISQLAQAKSLAEAATQAKDEFLATMSHEIRTPMNAVVGMISMLQRSRLDAEQRRLISVVSEATTSLLGVVNDVLEFSKLDSRRQNIEVGDFDVRQMVNEVMSVAQEYPGARNLVVESRTSPAVPRYVIGDRARISRVLLNLVTNAIKYTPRGRVGLALDSRPEADGSHLLTFTVSDTGMGIPPEKQSAIFEPFVQVKEAGFSPHEGTGLGLAIAQRIVAAMHGKLEVTSAVGRGSTFTVSIALPAGSAPEPRAAGAGAARRRGLRVLVAEDTTTSQTVIRLILESMGHSVKVVSDGAKAVESFSREQFDLVIMDIQMPVMDGYEAARRIKQVQADRTLAGGESGDRPAPIVGLSAFAQMSDRQRAIGAGMLSYLPKPIRFEDVEALLEKLDITPREPIAAEAHAPAPQAAPPAAYGSARRNSELGDSEIRSEMRQLLGSQGYAAAVQEFERDARQTLARLQSAAASADTDAVRSAAHRLKGLFLQFDVQDMAGFANQIELAPHAVRSPAAISLLAGAGHAIDCVLSTGEVARAHARTSTDAHSS